MDRRIGWSVAAIGAALIAYETLTPSAGELSHFDFCILCGYFVAVDIALNIALFVPLGAGLRLAGGGTARATAISAMLSLLIEIAQTRIPGRDPSLRDVLSNVLGAALGAGLAASWRYWLVPDGRRARMLLEAGAVYWCGMLACSGWLMQPRQVTTTLWGEWATTLTQFGEAANFGGSLLTLTLNGEPLPWGPVPDSPAWRETIRRDGARLDARVVAGPATPGNALIAWLEDESGGDIAILSQDGRDLVFQPGLRATELGLRTVALRLPNAFPIVLGLPSTLSIGGGLSRGTMRAWHAENGVADTTSLALSPSLAWTAILPLNTSFRAGSARLLSCLWICALALPLGWWAGAVRRQLADWTTVALLMVVLAPAALPLVFGVPAQPLDGLAAAAGLLLGGTIGVHSLRRRGLQAQAP